MVQAHWVFLCAGVAAPLRGVLVSGELPGLASVVIVVAAAVGAEAAEIFEDFGIEDGGTDFVDSGGPLAEVDFAAAVAAEGEVFAVEGYEFAAGGAAEKSGGFFLWSGHGSWCCLGAAIKVYDKAWKQEFRRSTIRRQPLCEQRDPHATVPHLRQAAHSAGGSLRP